MNNFFELINFYKIIVEFSGNSDSILAAMLNKTIPETILMKKEADTVDLIVELINENNNVDTDFFKEELKFTDEQVHYYFIAIQALFPNKISIKNILKGSQIKRLLVLKKYAAIQFLINRNISQISISDRLDVEMNEIKELLSNVPAIIENNHIIQDLREEAIVRDFFTIHSYATLRESAKILKISAQKIRTIVGKLRLAGEDIKATDMPVAINKEIVGTQVINLKINQPSLTTVEISLKLGISTQEVKRAINDMVRIWQIEKAESYEFHFAKTSNSLDEIKTEAWAQHNGSKNPSSRWMEMILSATEKQIAMHGLKAPEKLDIRQDIRLSKVERDNVVNAAIAADVIDIDYNNIQVTGTHD